MTLEPIPASQAKMIVSTDAAGIEVAIVYSFAINFSVGVIGFTAI